MYKFDGIGDMMPTCGTPLLDVLSFESQKAISKPRSHDERRRYQLFNHIMLANQLSIDKDSTKFKLVML